MAAKENENSMLEPALQSQEAFSKCTTKNLPLYSALADFSSVTNRLRHLGRVPSALCASFSPSVRWDHICQGLL